MSILIKGMEMPQGNSTINVLIYADGTVYTGHVNDPRYSAVSVSTPHGRLIDVNDFMRHLINNVAELRTLSAGTVGNALRDTPTIIEAEGDT